MIRHFASSAFARSLAFALLIAPGLQAAAPEKESSQDETREAATAPRPNIILVMCDNLGYGDIEPFGSTLHRTPHLNRMAREGMKFTHFYSASGVCTPSRAALMTGCYPQRVGMHETDGIVLRPVSPIGLHPDEITIAEVLKQAGYATACIGKWHLGDQPPFLPTQQGFDHYVGIPYSDDMTPRPGKNWPPLPLMHNETVVEAPVDRDQLTRKLNEAAVEWIKAHADEPFFLYYPEAMPGSTSAPFASERFKGKSQNGPWGDSIEELDWSLGRLLETVEELGIGENTLIIWTSDNGAPRRQPPQGSNKPLGGWGYTTQEGGMRVPCIMRWTGHVPAGGEQSELATLMDLLPTFAHLAGTEPPGDRIIDGKDIRPLLTRVSAETPHEAFYYYHVDQLQAVRSGRWKLHLAIEPVSLQPTAKPQTRPAQLYDVVADPGETTNLIAQHPEVVARLEKLAEQARTDLGDHGRPGAHPRPAGRVAEAQPQVLEN
ncbi:sulfatase family protein [Candidatus Laterigemmans baculatus]|uniref:sulfatase family protein n=1 Tax=Candidatus Laterigemmans baculatus TaxID=2770505 RepID=UPI0013DD71CF|nr:sulfatase [Candidatus Laterigemmans baculatus]